MTRIQLRIYSEPGEVDIFCQVKFADGNYERLKAIVDTGAAVSLFPRWLRERIVNAQAEQSEVTIDQAGIAGQSFVAVEVPITILLEDQVGNLTQPFVIPAWFADTDQPLLGFAGVLDRAVLHIDMPYQTGWLEIDV